MRYISLDEILELHSLISNHPFVDGNKRIGHAAMEIFLLLNDLELRAPFDDQERTILAVAAGQTDREQFTNWVRRHVEKPEKA